MANIVVPDTLKVDFNQPSGFPNGRRLTDSVIELAWLFLDQDFPGRAIDALRENRGTEVKRRAQVLAF